VDRLVGCRPEQRVKSFGVRFAFEAVADKRRTAFRHGLPFRILRSNGHDEILARATNLPIGRAAFETAAGLYPRDSIVYCHGARIIERSKPSSRSNSD
jgi:hypothetical protein